MIGPGMLALPVVYQQAGWLPCTIMLLAVWIVSTLCSTMYCECIDILRALVKQRPSIRFNKAPEFSNVVQFYYGDMWYAVSQLSYNISLQTVNIASIVISAQATDNLLIFSFGSTAAIQISPALELVYSNVSIRYYHLLLPSPPSSPSLLPPRSPSCSHQFLCLSHPDFTDEWS
jgi:amino acid permease